MGAASALRQGVAVAPVEPDERAGGGQRAARDECLRSSSMSLLP